MEDYTFNRQGLSTVTDWWDKGGKYNAPVTTVRSLNQIREGLSVYQDHVGVPNDPNVNAHEYLRFKVFYPTGVHEDRSLSNPNYTLFKRVEGLGVDGIIPNRGSYELTRDSTAYRKALRKLYDDIRGSDLNLSVDLAESGQAYKMVKGATRDVIDIVKKLPKGKGLANAWLAYSYGWRPLFQSIYGVCEFAQTNLLQREVVGRGYARIPVNPVVQNQPPWLKRSGFVDQTCILGGRIIVKNRPLYDLTRLASLNPLGIAWELVPLSFVSDWFYDIGGYLADVETSIGIGYDFRYGYQTWVTRSTELFGGSFKKSVLYGSNSAERTSSFKSAQKFVHKIREPLASVPFPPRPVFKPELGSSQLLSAAALIRQKFK